MLKATQVSVRRVWPSTRYLDVVFPFNDRACLRPHRVTFKAWVLVDEILGLLLRNKRGEGRPECHEVSERSGAIADSGKFHTKGRRVRGCTRTEWYSGQIRDRLPKLTERRSARKRAGADQRGELSETTGAEVFDDEITQEGRVLH